MTISQSIAETAEALKSFGAGNPRFEAELFLAEALQVSRVFLFAHPEEEVEPPARERFEALIARRLASEPLQYILGTADFRYLSLAVGPGVLIPRSETEGLVGHAWEGLTRWAEAFPARARMRPWVVDVGVGSGTILLALQHEAVRSGSLWFRPLGVDLSARALVMTAENAHRNDLSRPDLILGDLMAAIAPGDGVAAIVSNPPYITTAEMAALPAEIREHEPHEALHGGCDGLAVVRTLLGQAEPYLRQGTLLSIEIGATQAQAVREELERRNLLESSRIYPDLAGRPRVVQIEPF